MTKKERNFGELITGALFVAIAPTLADILPNFLKTLNSDFGTGLNEMYQGISYSISGLMLLGGLILMLFTLKEMPEKVNKGLSKLLILYTLGVIIFLILLEPLIWISAVLSSNLKLEITSIIGGIIVFTSIIISILLIFVLNNWINKLLNKNNKSQSLNKQKKINPLLLFMFGKEINNNVLKESILIVFSGIMGAYASDYINKSQSLPFPLDIIMLVISALFLISVGYRFLNHVFK
ncbi:MAG: hypothetical protein WC393_02840 [Candidatus Nanoarchaeia archaeon]|jgi:hypothetical protein